MRNDLDMRRTMIEKKPIFSRRSIRKFKPIDIPKKDILSIIEAGRTAPSAKNRQPWKCIVFGGKEKDSFLNEMKKGLSREENNDSMLPNSRQYIPDAKNTLRIMREAPILIIVLNSNGESPFKEIEVEHRITEICDSLSIGAFIENMILQAEELGIGSLWIANTCFAYSELVSYLHTNYQLVGAVAFGYANESPRQRPRKTLEDIVEFRLSD